jgi:hypothetical protein
MNTSIIEPIDVNSILLEYFKLENKLQWANGGNQNKQSGLQYRNDEDPFISATGKLIQGINEYEYSILNPIVKDTIFETLINKYKLVRTRFMWVGPRSCYSIHADQNDRVHIPIITNKDSMFLFPENFELIHLPVGNVYKVFTTKFHSFCNFSKFHRLHLVGCLVN